MSAPRPWNLVAELTYRCPLRCVYCSNPIAYRDVKDALDGAAWAEVFRQAAELGVVHVGLTGGEPTLHPDLRAIVAAADEARLYTHLVTAGTTLDRPGLAALRGAGLRSVQLSFQDDRPGEADRVAGAAAHARKLAFAREVRAEGLALIVNVVLHRHNMDRVDRLIELARSLDAFRIELANTQYYGWALANRAALLPTRRQVEAAAEVAARAARTHPRPEILFVKPDYHADRPKACMRGWGRHIVVVRPDGQVLPCHNAALLPLEFWNATAHSLAACWADAPGMNAFRGEHWMREPCRSCPERDKDLGGCRCQAFHLTGDAANTDPACSLSAHHGRIVAAREAAEGPAAAWVHRGAPGPA